MIDVRHQALDARHGELGRHPLAHEPVHGERGLAWTVPVTLADRIGLGLETGAEPLVLAAEAAVEEDRVEPDTRDTPGPGDRPHLGAAQIAGGCRRRPSG